MIPERENGIIMSNGHLRILPKTYYLDDDQKLTTGQAGNKEEFCK